MKITYMTITWRLMLGSKIKIIAIRLMHIYRKKIDSRKRRVSHDANVFTNENELI